MATSNFSYENRCVVVTDNDYEEENLPERGEWIGRDSREVITNENLYFFKVIITPGYYEHACIDYDRVENLTDYRCDFEQEMDYLWDGESKRSLYCAIADNYPTLCKCKRYGLTKYRFNKVTKGLNNNDALDAVLEYLKGQEEKVVNGIIDKIKEDYGYIEVERYATFDNGETIYQKVS